MRVWLIGLGLIGLEYKLIRHLMVSCQSGCSSWRFVPPPKKAAALAGTPEDAPSEAVVEDREPPAYAEDRAAVTTPEAPLEAAGIAPIAPDEPAEALGENE